MSRLVAMHVPAHRRLGTTRKTSSDGATAGSRGAGDLQRTVGNAAVAPMRESGRVQRVAIQREGGSAALLEKLATPKVGEGQSIEVQKELVNALEPLAKAKKDFAELNLGGILIESLPDVAETYEGKDQDELYGKLVDEGSGGAARFVPLKGVIGGPSSGVPFGDEVAGAGLGPKVVQNSLRTMIDAGQFEYLRLAGIPNKDWKILVEVHYIRTRPKDMAGFHKDTRGQSLFVNLNYHAEGKAKDDPSRAEGMAVRGPEYVLNPPPSAEHDELIFGTDKKQGTLPKQFTDDLAVTRGSLGEPSEMKLSGTVKPYGYVAFVDEAIHHATPWFGHRFVTPKQLKEYLQRKHRDEFEAITEADSKSRASYFWSLESYLSAKVIAANEINKWKTWLAMTQRDEKTRYTRSEFKGTMDDDEFDRMLADVGGQPGAVRESAGAGGWHSANISGSPNSPITPKDKPPLKRQASNADLTKDLPEQLPEDVPRRFLRCWVRAVPKELAAKLRSS